MALATSTAAEGDASQGPHLMPPQLPLAAASPRVVPPLPLSQLPPFSPVQDQPRQPLPSISPTSEASSSTPGSSRAASLEEAANEAILEVVSSQDLLPEVPGPSAAAAALPL